MDSRYCRNKDGAGECSWWDCLRVLALGWVGYGTDCTYFQGCSFAGRDLTLYLPPIGWQLQTPQSLILCYRYLVRHFQESVRFQEMLNNGIL